MVIGSLEKDFAPLGANSFFPGLNFSFERLTDEKSSKLSSLVKLWKNIMIQYL